MIDSIDDDHVDIRPLMAEFPSGVTVVTAYAPGGLPRGMTCTSVLGVSLAPPTIAVCLRQASLTLHAILASEVFAVNLLHSAGRDIAVLFGSGDQRRFDVAEWTSPAGAGGPHLVDSAHMIADCVLIDGKDVGDHAVVFGEVERFRRTTDDVPLLYGRRRYAAWPH